MARSRRFGAVLGVVVVIVPLLAQMTGAAAAEPILERVAGTIGEGTATNVGQRPQGIAVHGTTLYISDGDGTDVVRAVDLVTGKERIVAGITAGTRRDNVPATETTLTDPKGLATDAAGNLYIADGQVRKLDTKGILSTVAGSFTYQGVPGGDGGPATQAAVSAEDMALDAAGNLYIADYFGHRVRKVDAAGIITTVAGNGSTVSYGDGGPATAAGLYRPSGVAVDSQGNLYIAQAEQFRVRKVDTAGIITTFAGTGVAGVSGDGGPAASAQLADPRDIAIDGDGNVYIADTYGYRIRKVDTTGTMSTFAGNGQYGTGGDGGPATAAQLLAFDIAFDGAGNLYFADSWRDKVRRIDRQGIVTTVAGNGFTHFRGDGGPALDAQVHAIQRLAIDPVSGRLAFADSGSMRIRTIDAAGVVSTIYVGQDFDFWLFSGLAYDSYGNLYVGERGRIRRIDRSGTVTVVAGGGEPGTSGDGGLAADAKIGYPSSLTFDPAGTLYFTDADNGRIRKISTSGVISTVAGSGVQGLSGDGDPATAAKIWPWYGAEVAVDGVGNVYLADSYNDRIRKVDPSGTITSVGGGQVKFPTGMALDGAGNLFVASAQDHKVRKMTPGGVWSTVAGNGTYGFGGEGGPATSAELALMGFGMGGDVAVDQHGTLFIGGFQRIWKVNGVAAPVTFPLPLPTTSSTTTTPPTSSTTTSTTTSTTMPGPSANGLYHSLPPARILDTRTGPPVAADGTITPTVTGVGGVPATGVSAVVMNVTVTQPAAPGFLTLYPNGAPRPLASNLNFLTNQTVPNLVVAKVGADGKVAVYNGAGPTHVVLDVVGWFGSDAATAGGGAYAALPPARILDTRSGAPVASGATITPTVAGVGGVPSTGVSAVVLNVTVTQPTAASFLTVYPNGTARPLASNLNFLPNETVPNLVVAKVGADGKVAVYNSSGSTHVVLDVVGWFGSDGAGTSGGRYNALTPSRLLDTRSRAPVPPGATISQTVTGVGGVPATGVSAVVLNVTVTQPTAPSYLTVFPSGTTPPLASNLNFLAGQTVPNLVMAKVGADGKVAVYNSSGSTHVVLDVVGWYSA